jgi:hypothetical protein
MTLRFVVPALSADDMLYLPPGEAGLLPAGHGTTMFVAYTSPEKVPEGRFTTTRADDFAGLVGDYDVVNIDPPTPGGAGVVSNHIAGEPSGAVLGRNSYVPARGELWSASLTRRRSFAPGEGDVSSRVLTRVTTAHDAAVYSAFFPKERVEVRDRWVWLVVAPTAQVDTVADELLAGFGLTPHPTVLVGARSDYPWSTRIRMRS